MTQCQQVVGFKEFSAVVFVGLAIWGSPLRAQPASGNQDTNEIRIVELQGTAEISPAGTTR